MKVSIPDIVDYPELYDIKSNFSMFNGVFSYVIERYELCGYSMYIGFRDQYSLCRISDFNSNEIGHDKLDDKSIEVLSLYDQLKEVMRYTRIADALFYFSDDDDEIRLVDVMISANKFLGPGMLNDLFGNVVNIQKVIDKIVIDENNISNLNSKILKPSKFKYLVDNSVVRPMYGIVN